MKKIATLVLLAAVITSCQQKQYYRSSKEIDLIRKMHNDYLAGDWLAMRAAFADTASVWVNSWWGEATSADVLVSSMRNASRKYAHYSIDNDAMYEMFVTDNGEHWVNSLYQWRAMHKSGNEVKTVFQGSYLVKNGKIVKHTLIFNQLPLFLVDAMSKQDSSAVR